MSFCFSFASFFLTFHRVFAFFARPNVTTDISRYRRDAHCCSRNKANIIFVGTFLAFACIFAGRKKRKNKKCEVLLDHIFATKKRSCVRKHYMEYTFVLYIYVLFNKVIFILFKLYAYHHFRKLNSANLQCFLC